MLVVALSGLLSGCAPAMDYRTWSVDQPRPFGVAEIEAEPDRFVEENLGRRVLVEGYFAVDSLRATCDFTRPQGSQTVELDLSLSSHSFNRSVHRWVVVSAIVTPPAPRRLGGGDLVIEVPIEGQATILADARLVAVDEDRSCRARQG